MKHHLILLLNKAKHEDYNKRQQQEEFKQMYWEEYGQEIIEGYL